jgi:hypothetical protein
MQHMRRGRDVLPAGIFGATDSVSQRLLGPNLRQFDQHGQIHAGDYLNAFPLHHRDGEITWGSSKHVGQQHDPVARVASADTGLYFRPPIIHVVIRSDADRVYVALRPNHMFHGRTQLVCQTAMRYKDHADHERTEMSARKIDGVKP